MKTTGTNKMPIIEEIQPKINESKALVLENLNHAIIGVTETEKGCVLVYSKQRILGHFISMGHSVKSAENIITEMQENKSKKGWPIFIDELIASPPAMKGKKNPAAKKKTAKKKNAARKPKGK